MSPAAKATLAAVIANLLIGFSFYFTVISLRFASVIDTLFMRFAIGFFIFLILKFAGIIKFSFQISDFKRILPISILYPCMFFGFQALGLSHATSVECGIISAFSPIFTVILAMIFLGENPNFRQWLCIIASIAGIFIVFGVQFMQENAEFHALGIIFMIVSIFAISANRVALRAIARKFSLSAITFNALFIGFLFFGICSFLTHANSNSFPEFLALFKNGKFLFATTYLAVFGNILTLYLFPYSLRTLEAFKVGILNNLSIIITVFVGILLLNEAFYPHYIVGSVIIILSVIFLNLAQNRKI